MANKVVRRVLLITALALSAGVIWEGSTFLGLVLTVLIFERIVEVWS